VPYRTVRKWCLTGEPFSTAEAKKGGLLSYVVPALELDSKTQRLIDRLAGKSPTAIRRGKYAMRAVGSMSFDEGIAYTEGQIALLVITKDAEEGLASFNEERRPVWSGC
jgi:enoyl-CoA hydratase/carnithine racemase